MSIFWVLRVKKSGIIPSNLYNGRGTWELNNFETWEEAREFSMDAGLFEIADECQLYL